MSNYSKQRAETLAAVKELGNHPTAAAVYEKVREKIPNISLGTVYRNLSALSESGDIDPLPVGDGTLRYDGDTSAHVHLTCTACGGIEDIYVVPQDACNAALKHGFAPDKCVCIVYGICKKCKAAQKAKDAENHANQGGSL